MRFCRIEADVNGVSEEEQVVLRITHFSTNPMTGTVCLPTRVKSLIGGGDGERREIG
jgi:hypothetical protein